MIKPKSKQHLFEKGKSRVIHFSLPCFFKPLKRI